MASAPFSVASSPHVLTRNSVPRLMFAVIVALAPATVLAVVFFGLPAIRTILFTLAFSLLFEAVLGVRTSDGLRWKEVLGDGSGAVTGLLLALNLPPDSPWWVTAVGALVAIGLGKHVFGGLGKNPFNPALVARVVLVIAFPVQMTAWRAPFHPVDGVTAATALGVLQADGAVAAASRFPLWSLYTGRVPGCLGEVSALALLAGGIFLLLRRVITWHIPVAYLGSVAAFTGILWIVDPGRFASPLFHLGAGSLMLGAWYMATDLVTSPLTRNGMLVFGAGCGAITCVIRLAGSYPEGVSFAILVMNALTPLIDKWTHPVPTGRRVPRPETA